ncbi:MAG: HlyD family type I secretion periplasmic adaptor subunit [Gammaproteobacteria bacterium]|nr:HlyD family type I secretion periplasmic adaptor subunit [Gammaproteobacteria bacterium]
MFSRTHKQQKADLAYMQSLSAAVMQQSPRHLIVVLLIMALFVVSAILWMSFAEIDIVVRGGGKVIPTQQLQVVQSLEGGVVSEIMVQEGQIVDRLQALIKISDIAFSSSFQENRLTYHELLAKVARLTAESSGEPFKADEEIMQHSPRLMRSEESLFLSNLEQLNETRQILQEQINQHKSSLLEAQAKQRQSSKSLSLMREELNLKKPLIARGLVSEVEYLQLQQKEAELAGDLEAANLAIPRLQSTIEESKSKMEQAVLDFRNKAKRELNEVMAEVSRLSETQEALKDRVQRTTLRSPLKGTISRMHVNTIGGVIQAGGPVLEIVPYEDNILIEIKIKPADIADITIGQKARLKFSAYDFAIHGSLEGEVYFLSADTITDEEGMSYYVARIKPVHSFLGKPEQKLPIRVGMTVDADILTDKNTVLQYLFKPIRRGLGRALGEG